MNLAEKQRENWIDIIKGIAMLFIIIGHVSDRLTGWWTFSWMYGVHVLIFFVMSGYTLKKRKLTREYVNSRFSRLMVPYFYTCFAVILMDVINSRVIAHNFFITEIAQIIGRDLIRSFLASGTISNFGAVEIGSRIGAIWFLPAMFFATMITQIVLQKVTDEKKQGLILAGIALLAVITRDFFWLPFSIQSGMMGAFFIWIGYVVKSRAVLVNLKWYHYSMAQGIYLWGYYTGYAFASIVQAKLADIFLSTIVGLSGCLLLTWIARRIEKAEGLAYLGRISLTILCVHLFALETMGRYFDKVLNWLNLEDNPRIWGLIGIEILFAVVGAVLIEQGKAWIIDIRNRNAGKQKTDNDYGGIRNTDRDICMDIVRGFLLMIMLVGQYSIGDPLRKIIFSCHFTAFVILSGYFYKPSKNKWEEVRHLSKKLLLPYAVYVVLYILLHFRYWSTVFFKETFIQYLLGSSFGEKVFVNSSTVGPVCFLLVLFLTKLMYLLLKHLCQSERIMTVFILIVSVLGMMLGQKGIRLPWSADIAMFSLIFYHTGVLLQKHSIPDMVQRTNVMYFIVSSLWAYMIYAGNLDITVRNYGNYGLVIIGAAAGVLVIIQLSGYIKEKLPVGRKILSACGRYGVCIIVVHVLLHDVMKGSLGRYLNPDFMPFLIATILIELIIAMVAGLCIEVVKSKKAN